MTNSGSDEVVSGGTVAIARLHGYLEQSRRGAAAGAAVNRSHHTTDEPYTTHPHAPETPKRGVPPPRFSSASRSRDERGRGAHRFESNKATTMARSLGSSMARGLGILLIMMTLSEIAATRARRRPATQTAAPSPWASPRAPRPRLAPAAAARPQKGSPTHSRDARRAADAHLIQKRRLRI